MQSIEGPITQLCYGVERYIIDHVETQLLFTIILWAYFLSGNIIVRNIKALIMHRL